MLDKYQRINKQGSLSGRKVILCGKTGNRRGELSAKKWLLSIFAVALLLCGCADGAMEEGAKEYVHISLFCDVDFWVPPKWETEEDTITGKITQKTNVVVDTNVPPQDANSHLRLMLANGELPDVISVTDKTTISQLVSSGKVWSLEELLEQYLPDSAGREGRAGAEGRRLVCLSLPSVLRGCDQDMAAQFPVLSRYGRLWI